MARARGQQPREFVLTLWGGHTAFGGATPTPATSALIAVRRADREPPARGGVLRAGPAGGLGEPGRAAPVVRLPDQRVRRRSSTSSPACRSTAATCSRRPCGPSTKNRHTGTVAAGWVRAPRRGRRLRVGAAAAAHAGRQPDLVDVVWAALIGAFLWSGASAAVRGGRSQKAVGQLTLATVGRRAVGRRPHRVDRARGCPRGGGRCRRGRDPLARRPTGRLRRPRGRGRRSPPTSPARRPSPPSRSRCRSVPSSTARSSGRRSSRAVGRGDRHSPVVAARGRTVGWSAWSARSGRRRRHPRLDSGTVTPTRRPPPPGRPAARPLPRGRPRAAHRPARPAAHDHAGRAEPRSTRTAATSGHDAAASARRRAPSCATRPASSTSRCVRCSPTTCCRCRAARPSSTPRTRARSSRWRTSTRVPG